MTRKGEAVVKILIVANRRNPHTVDALYQIMAFCDSQGIDHVELDVVDLPGSDFVYGAHDLSSVDERLEDGADLVVTLGGDGTLLHSTRLSAVLNAPTVGINFGHLGFLANTATEGVIPLLADVLSGEVIREERMTLHIYVTCEGDEEEGIAPRELYALNEIAIARGTHGNIVDFQFRIAGDHIARMRGDGLIISTATGSTAYALAAGGPLVGCGYRGMIVVPLAPHTLNSRAIVTEHNDIVEVDLPLDAGGQPSEVSLAVDGDSILYDMPVRKVIVKVGERPATILSCRAESFYKHVSRTFFQ